MLVFLRNRVPPRSTPLNSRNEGVGRSTRTLWRRVPPDATLDGRNTVGSVHQSICSACCYCESTRTAGLRIFSCMYSDVRGEYGMDDVLLFKGRFALTAIPGRFAAPQAAPIHKSDKKKFVAKFIILYLCFRRLRWHGSTTPKQKTPSRWKYMCHRRILDDCEKSG